MKQKQVVKKIFRYVFITFTATLYAVGIALFLNPNNLAPGGISGIAIILKKMFPGLPGVGMLILLINIPILAVGIKKFGIKFILSTMYSLIVSSVLIDILPIVFNVNGVTDNKMLASVIGGATFGLGMGLMFRLDTTTGGLDIFVKIIKQKKPHLKTGQIYFFFFFVILAASAMSFKDVEVALYAAIAIYVSTVVMDRAIYGGDEATLVYIISEKRELIARRMMKEVNVGATMIQAKGAYSNETTEVIMCVMKKQTLVKVRNILKQTDSGAFMIVSSANEVFGQGFKDHFKTEI